MYLTFTGKISHIQAIWLHKNPESLIPILFPFISLLFIEHLFTFYAPQNVSYRTKSKSWSRIGISNIPIPRQFDVYCLWSLEVHTAWGRMTLCSGLCLLPHIFINSILTLLCPNLNNKFYSHPSQQPYKKDASAFSNYHIFTFLRLTNLTCSVQPGP